MTGTSDNIPLTSRAQWQQVVSTVACGYIPPRRKRREDRFPVEFGFADMIAFVEVDHSAIEAKHDAKVLEVSPGGITLRVQRRIPVGSFVAMRANVNWQPCVLLGSVRHCTCGLGGWKIGIELDFIAEESEEAGEPPAEPASDAIPQAAPVHLPSRENETP